MSVLTLPNKLSVILQTTRHRVNRLVEDSVSCWVLLAVTSGKNMAKLTQEQQTEVLLDKTVQDRTTCPTFSSSPLTST